MKEYVIYLTKPPETKLLLAIDMEEAFDIACERYRLERVHNITEVNSELVSDGNINKAG